jgi:hypothetical protein
LEKLLSCDRLENFHPDVFRGLYVPDAEKKTLEAGNTPWIDRVPDVGHNGIRRWQLRNFSESKKYKTKMQEIMIPRIIFKVLRGSRLVCWLDLEGHLLTTEKLVNCRIPDSLLPIAYIIWNSYLPSYILAKFVFSEVTEISRVLDYQYLKMLPLRRMEEISGCYTNLVNFANWWRFLGQCSTLSSVLDRKESENIRNDLQIVNYWKEWLGWILITNTGNELEAKMKTFPRLPTFDDEDWARKLFIRPESEISLWFSEKSCLARLRTIRSIVLKEGQPSPWAEEFTRWTLDHEVIHVRSVLAKKNHKGEIKMW